MMIRSLLIVAGVLAGMVFRPGSAEATAGTVSLSWGTCSPVIANLESPASGPLTLVVSVIGHDEPHRAYLIRLLIRGTDDLVPDAWRFDAAGCQTGAFLQIRPTPSGLLSKSCPAFQGDGVSYQLQSYDYIPPSDELASYLPETWMLCRFASTYPAGNTAVASQRYHLATFVFDHTYSDEGPTTPGETCGGFERPMILSPHWSVSRYGLDPWGFEATYVDSDGLEREFQMGSDHTVTVNGSVPAARTTWGQIKSAYRR